ncbi:hypothetical protein OS188_02070 [Xanthomarina sp. F1114]|uniref:hypothetical protein n=1 Tax=Xanthomarina sp. F1114 TaxID=2996019 RepID=UPI00225E1108|nr:hypothetical protein [Xanthomarina sp. F1114]MCX7546734.1 hypothetical protein [Xanthomarina sp. F1114]
MSKGINKPKDNELREDLISILEIKERIKTLDLIRLKELVIYLDKSIQNLLKTITNRGIACPDESFEYTAKNCFQYGYNYYDLISLREFILKRINELEQPLKNTNDNQLEDLPKWFPIGLGFATGEIQEMINKGISASQIAIKRTKKRSNANYVSFTSNNTTDLKNIYSDFDKLELVYNYCIEKDINICNDFMNAYNIKLKELN